MKAPLARGFNSGRLRGLGGVGGPLSLKQHQRREVVPKNETARVRGVPAIPRRSPRTPPSPGPHRYVVNIRLGRWRKGGTRQKNSDRPITICAGDPNSVVSRSGYGLNEMNPRERPSASPPNDGRVL